MLTLGLQRRLMVVVTRFLSLGVVLLTLPAITAAQQATPPPFVCITGPGGTCAQSCGAFQFFFARGTNERLNDQVTHGFGDVGLSTWDLYGTPQPGVNRATPGGAVAFPVRYNDFSVANPVELLGAIGEIGTQATANRAGAVAALRDQLSAAALECPMSKFVLVGYSFGAMVIQRYMHLSADPVSVDSARSRVAAVLLYGDPTWPLLPELQPRRGLATAFLFGFATKEEYIPTTIPRDRFSSLCLSYDLKPPTVGAQYTAYDPICLTNVDPLSVLSPDNILSFLTNPTNILGAVNTVHRVLSMDENFRNCFFGLPGTLEIQCPHRQYHLLGQTKSGADWLAAITGAK